MKRLALTSALPGNRRLGAALAAIALLTALLFARWGADYHASNLSETESLLEEYAAYSALAQRSAHIASAARESERRIVELEAMLIKAGSASTAAAALQEAVKAIARKRGIVMTAERPLPVEAAGPYARVPVEFQFRTSLGGLESLVRDIESSGMLLGAKAMKVKRAAEGGRETLDVALVIEGAIKR